MAQAAVDQQTGAIVPKKGEWPVDPQDAVEVSKDNLWIDGCFDFAHHGMLRSVSLRLL